MVGESQAGHSWRAGPYRLLGQLGTQVLGDEVEIEYHRSDSGGCERGSKAAPFRNSDALGGDSLPGYREGGIPR
jgi:hypothetical protein